MQDLTSAQCRTENSKDQGTLIATVSLSLFSNKDHRKCCHLRNELLRGKTPRNPFAGSPEDSAAAAAQDE